jgi:hypothetical protein
LDRKSRRKLNEHGNGKNDVTRSIKCKHARQEMKTECRYSETIVPIGLHEQKKAE